MLIDEALLSQNTFFKEEAGTGVELTQEIFCFTSVSNAIKESICKKKNFKKNIEK